MSVVTLKSTAITNRDASPTVHTDSQISGGQRNEAFGFVFTGAADSAGSAYKLCQVPSDARITDLQYVANTLGSGCFFDVGVWYPTALQPGGMSFLSSALAGVMVSSSNFKTNIAEASTTTWTTLMDTGNTRQGVNYQEMALWQMLNLSADPGIYLDLGFSIRLAVATAGYIGLKASYIA